MEFRWTCIVFVFCFFVFSNFHCSGLGCKAWFSLEFLQSFIGISRGDAIEFIGLSSQFRWAMSENRSNITGAATAARGLSCLTHDMPS